MTFQEAIIGLTWLRQDEVAQGVEAMAQAEVGITLKPKPRTFYLADAKEVNPTLFLMKCMSDKHKLPNTPNLLPFLGLVDIRAHLPRTTYKTVITHNNT